MKIDTAALVYCILSFFSVAIAEQLENRPESPAVPAWLMEKGCLLFQEGNADIASIEEASQCGVNIICGGTNAGGVGFAGGPYLWDGKDRIYNMWTGEDVDIDAIRAKVDQAHRLGMKVLGEYMRMWHQEQLYIKHPEWQELSKPTRVPHPPDKKTEWPPVTGCWNSPFGDFYIQQSIYLAEKLGWDGISLDGFGNWRCFCPSCVKSFKEETGLDITFEDANNPNWRRYIKWRLDRYDRFVERWQKALKEANPDLALIPWSTGPGRWWHWSFSPKIELSDYANRLIDAPIVELFWDFPPDQASNLMPSITVRYYRGLTAERPVFMLPYFCTQGQQPMVAPQVECDFRVLTVIANGARPAMSCHQLQRNEPVQQLNHLEQLIKSRDAWTLDAKTMKWAAMLMSQNSRIFHGLLGYKGEHGYSWIGSGVDSEDAGDAPPGERRLPTHIESAVGVFRAMQEEHLPIDIITDADLDGDASLLDSYRVLILPNAACLSDQALKNIEQFAQRGGGVVAIHETSLLNEMGDRRDDFGLNRLLGVSYEGVSNHTARWPDYPNPISIGLRKHFITCDPVIDGNYRVQRDVLNFIGLCTDVKATPDTQVLSMRGPDDQVINWKNAESDKTISKEKYEQAKPFLVINQSHQGRTAYFAADIGQSYHVTPYQYQRKLITNAIRWVAGSNGPAVSVEAPMCVAATFYQREQGRQFVVHLLNELNTTTNRALPEGNSSMREEIVPLTGIKVIFHSQDITKATLQPENIDLPLSKRPGQVEVVVPQLNLHSMVIAEK